MKYRRRKQGEKYFSCTRCINLLLLEEYFKTSKHPIQNAVSETCYVVHLPVDSTDTDAFGSYQQVHQI